MQVNRTHRASSGGFERLQSADKQSLRPGALEVLGDYRVTFSPQVQGNRGQREMSPDAGVIPGILTHGCHGATVMEKQLTDHSECTWQFEAVNIPDWKLSLRRAFSLMFTTSDRLLLHGDGGVRAPV
ncbi:hypothetical protein D4764_21G0003430 [Takifugu flavidus]|uniref:Uncharacterized protein n=1 Tax=Takifugu flavidus TaxID=433684 RepID=A0A5C6NE22_9TELE|nr:hypothetical protein D4764_21G0003430 [Takifugu flavidus]